MDWHRKSTLCSRTSLSQGRKNQRIVSIAVSDDDPDRRAEFCEQHLAKCEEHQESQNQSGTMELHLNQIVGITETLISASNL